MEGNLNQLYSLKMEKLQSQKALSDKMNYHLTREGGLNESSNQTMKNLQAAIAVARKPGYFEYYKPSEDNINAENTKILNSLARAIAKIHTELELINIEIEKEEQEQLKKRRGNFGPTSASSVKQWLDIYGKPQNADIGASTGLLTTFAQGTKIYGGTKHHRAFKTQASVMLKGRMSR